ncbi:MAG: hypothetical protein OXI90_11470 [Gammaproteobacteria bacterium]|nr:hypothetical protein [Gammaproteobacteria bacterium]
MKRWMLCTSAGVLLAALAMLLGGCDPEWGQPETPQLETRTFALQHMEGSEAVDLIDPYVYAERVGAPGMVSEAKRDSRAITVRETADNLDRIAAVLAEFDRPSSGSLALKFQLISPNGSEAGPQIADVVRELDRFLRFDGYSLEGEALVSLVSGAFHQRIKAEEATYEISGVYWSRTKTLKINVRTNRPQTFGSNTITTVSGGRQLFTTEVVIQPGKTLVLGTVTGDETTAILVVRSLMTDPVDADPAET